MGIAYLGLPRGCDIDLVNLFDTHKVDIEWVDETCSGRPIDVEFNGELQGEQVDAAEAMLNFDNGVLLLSAHTSAKGGCPRC
jgi:hypothetical protein